MVRAATIGILALAVTAPLGASAEGRSRQPREGFLGFTEDVTAADEGLFQLQKLCQAEFGRNTRMCTVDEISDATRIPDLPEAAAWMNTRGWSEVYAGTSLVGNCGGWGGDPTGRGALVDNLGRFQSVDCTELHPVACCRVGP